MRREPKQWKIRQMRADDVSRVMHIAASLEQAPHWQESVYLKMLKKGSTPRRIAMVAENTVEELAGFSVAVLTPPEAELESIAVAAEQQRCGAAKALWVGLGTELREAGVTVVHLEVRVGNLPAQGLYRSLGFMEVGRRHRYYADPVEDAALYRIDLS